MRTRTIICCVLSLALLGSCGGAGGGQPIPPTESFTLTGTVAGPTGAALAGAQVLLGQSTTVANASGGFAFSNLPAGYYLASVQDSAGNFTCRQLQLSASTTSFTFTLPASPVGFEVTGVSPLLSSTGNTLNSNITIEFSQPPDADSVADAAGWFSPQLGGMTALYEAGSTTLVLDPLLQLPLGQQLTVELPMSVTSASGSPLAHVVRWRFRTEDTDTATPQLITTTPLAGASNHPPNLSAVFEFNEPLATAGTVQAVSVPAIELTTTISGRFLYVQPAAGWAKSTAYALAITGIADKAGNQFAGPLSLDFSTSATAAPATDIQPVWNRVTNTVLFASNRYGGYDIYQVNANGTALVRLTALPGDEQHPAVSNDGQRIAFQRRQPGERWSIFVQRLDGLSEAVRLTANEFNDQQPVFSNTISNQLVFVSDRADPTGLFLMNSDGTNLRETDRTFGSSQAYPSFHPLLDTQLLFASNRAGSQDVWRKTISAIDGSTINLNLTGEFLSDEKSPVFSPDASNFLFVSDYSGNNELWQAGADGAFPRQVTYFASDLADPALNPVSGSSVCVVSLPLSAGGRGLAVVDVISGELVRWLTGGEASD